MSVFESLSVVCPYCSQLVSIELEQEIVGEMVQDCEVCCRPWRVRVARDEDGEPSVVLERAQ